jgi:hypothetical protein
MTKAQIVKLIMDLGYPQAKAEKLTAGVPDGGTEVAAEDLDDLLTSCISHQHELYKNGDDFKTAIKTASDKKMGEINGKFEKRIITLAKLTPEEVKDKKADEILDLAWAKASKMGDKTADEIQEELRKKDEELRKINEEVIPGIRKEVDDYKMNFRSDNALLKELGAIKLRKGLDIDDMLMIVKNKATKSKYKMGFDDKDAFAFMTEDGTRIATDDKRNFKTNKDILTQMLDPYIEKSNADDDGEDGEGGKKKIIIDEKDKKITGGKSVQDATARALKHAESLGKDGQ